MSQAHRGSRLLLSGAVVPVDFSSAHFNYNLDTYGIQYGDMVSDNGSQVYMMRTFEGMFGGAVCIDQGTTNMITSPAPSIYNNGGNTASLTNLTNQTGETLYGQTIWRLQMTAPTGGTYLTSMQTNNEANQGVFYQSLTYNSGNTYMASVYWRAFKSDVSVGGQASNVPGWSDVRTDNFPNGWHRTQTQWNYTANETDNKFWAFKSPSTVANEVITIDWACPQIEERPWATAFTASSRAMGKLWYPSSIFNPSAFSVSCWFKIPYMHESNSPYYGGSNQGINTDWYHPIFEYAPTSNRGQVGFCIVAGPTVSPYNRRINLREAGGTGSDNYGSQAIQDNTWYHLVGTYDGSNYKVYINNVLQITLSAGVTSTYSDSVVMVGGGYEGAPNILISDLMISKSAMSQEDVSAIYLSQRPQYNPYDYRGYGF